MNIKQARGYFQTNGVNCPYCASDDLEGEAVDTDATKITQKTKCNGCGQNWKDFYKIMGVVDNSGIYHRKPNPGEARLAPTQPSNCIKLMNGDQEVSSINIIDLSPKFQGLLRQAFHEAARYRREK